jgi:hypothetical protein
MRRPILAILAFACLAAFSAAPLDASAGPAERAHALAQSLRTRRVANVAFEDARLDDVVRFLRIATSVNFHVRRDVIGKAGIDLDALRFTFALEDVTVATLLEIALKPNGLGAVVRDNVVHVTTRADAMGKPIARLYDIGHLTFTLTDFAAPSLDLHPSGYTAPEVEPEVVRDDGLDADKIVELLKTIVAEDWSQEGWAITPVASFLLVKAPASVHRDVALALQRIAVFK